MPDFSKYMAYLKRYGVAEIIRKYTEKKRYDESRDFYTLPQENISIQYTPCVSILVPVYNPEASAFYSTLLSVKKQTYDNWQLCISDSGTKKMKAVVEEVFGQDKRVIYISQEGRMGISDNSNEALKIASGEYIALFDHDDLLEPDALMEIVRVINRDNPDMIYTDEDKVSQDGNHFFEPYRKPDFNLPLLLSNNYLCHLSVIKKELFDSLGGFNAEFDGAQDYDLFLRVAEYTSRISHIGRILYHWRAGAESTSDNPFNKEYAFTAGKRALEAYLKRQGYGEVTEVTELSDLGYYRINYIGDVSGKVDNYVFLPECDRESFNKMAGYALLFKADIIVPKAVSHGRYIYNGRAKRVTGMTENLEGKPYWYRGRFNIGRVTLKVANTPESSILIRKDKLEHFKKHGADELMAVYVPEVVIKQKRKKI